MLGLALVRAPRASKGPARKAIPVDRFARPAVIVRRCAGGRRGRGRTKVEKYCSRRKSQIDDIKATSKTQARQAKVESIDASAVTPPVFLNTFLTVVVKATLRFCSSCT